MFWRINKRKKTKVVSPRSRDAFCLEDELHGLKEKNAEEILCRYPLLIYQINSLVLESLRESKLLHYRVGSRFLRDNYEVFCRSEKESVHLITGVETGSLNHLDEKLILKHEVRELVEAKILDNEINTNLQNLHFEGYKLFGCFHVHPGQGIGSTYPSSIDMELIDRFEAGKYKTVSAIFSRDGFIRFFAPFPFKIHIFGKGVRKINEELYCLVKIS